MNFLTVHTNILCEILNYQHVTCLRTSAGAKSALDDGAIWIFLAHGVSSGGYAHYQQPSSRFEPSLQQ